MINSSSNSKIKSESKSSQNFSSTEIEYCSIYNENEDSSMWWTIPEPVLLKIFSLLEPKDIISAGMCCKRWYQIAHDDFLWKYLIRRDFYIDSNNIGLKPGAESWNSEYKRLTTNVPLVLTETLEGHSHQVLHVSFSHNGEMFATCSKDGNVIIWNSSYPCTIRYSHNMKNFSWKYTQYSQFNQSDTLLLVSGIHFGSPQSTSGEIAVFSVGNGSYLRCRVVNRPYDIFGTWFSDQYLISGDLHWLAHLVSTSILWLNKANQEIDSEHVPIMNQLYKFYNRNASSIRTIMIANCSWLNDTNDPLKNESEGSTTNLKNTANNDFDRSQPSTSRSFNEDTAALSSLSEPSGKNDSTMQHLNEYRKEYENTSSSRENIETVNNSSSCTSLSSTEEERDQTETNDYEDDLETSIPKYLIFSRGFKTYTPHQIGIKRIRNVNFPKKLDPGPSLKERIEARKREREEQNNHPRVEPDWWNYEAVADRFDKIDKVIELHGHIIGMALSPDHRYLYVNTRPWPKDYIISNPLEPPPIAQEICINIIDLMTLEHVGNMLRAHKAYTPNTNCFFMFLDVCDNYVASGAEDMHAYLWDRYYGICLSKHKHNDVVNSVAFNPKDSEMLVTTSDDYTIKVWRSYEKAKKYKIENVPIATKFRKKIF